MITVIYIHRGCCKLDGQVFTYHPEQPAEDVALVPQALCAYSGIELYRQITLDTGETV
jgi:hypothetical protein